MRSRIRAASRPHPHPAPSNRRRRQANSITRFNALPIPLTSCRAVKIKSRSQGLTGNFDTTILDLYRLSKSIGSQILEEGKPMASKTWTLINTEKSSVLDCLSVRGAEISAAAEDCRIDYELLRGGLRDGLHLLTIDNGQIRVAILPERGLGLWKAWANRCRIGMAFPHCRPSSSPIGFRVSEPSGLGWLDGFDELLVRCGLYSNGAPEFAAQGQLIYPLHGHIANLPAHRLDVSLDESSGAITVRGIVDEKRFHFHKLRLVSTVRLHPG